MSSLHLRLPTRALELLLLLLLLLLSSQEEIRLFAIHASTAADWLLPNTRIGESPIGDDARIDDADFSLAAAQKLSNFLCYIVAMISIIIKVNEKMIEMSLHVLVSIVAVGKGDPPAGVTADWDKDCRWAVLLDVDAATGEEVPAGWRCINFMKSTKRFIDFLVFSCLPSSS